MKLQTLEFEFVTMPLSLNASLRPDKRTGRLFKTKEAVKWARIMNGELVWQKQSLPEFCYYSVSILYPGSLGLDVNNMDKAIIDLLVKADRMPDDFYMCCNENSFYAGDKVSVFVYQLDLDHWIKIRNPSHSTIIKLKASERLQNQSTTSQ